MRAFKALFLTAFFSLLVSPAFAGGSKAPDAQVSDFLGTYGTLVEDQGLKMGSGDRLPCPEALSVLPIETCDVDGNCSDETGVFVVNATTGDTLPFVWTSVNQGKRWNGIEFTESFTTSKRLVWETGYTYWEHWSPSPGHPDRPGAPTPPRQVEAVTFGYDLKLTDDGIVLGTYKYNSECRYLKN